MAPSGAADYARALVAHRAGASIVPVPISVASWGVLLGPAFIWRRSMWFVIGIHFAWNVIEGLLGIPVSGDRDPGLFLTTVHGAGLLSGGSFGLEASFVPVLVSLAVAIPMLVAAHRRARRQPTTAAPHR